MKMVYLASPDSFIGTAHDFPWMTIRGQIVNELQHTLTLVYRPYSAFKLPAMPVGEGESGQMREINNTAFLVSDGMIALLPEGSKTLAVPYRVGMARGIGKPLVVVTDAPGWVEALGSEVLVYSPHRWAKAVSELCKMMMDVPSVTPVDGDPEGA